MALLGVSKQRVHQLASVLRPQLVELPSGARRYRYDPHIVEAYRIARDRARLQRIESRLDLSIMHLDGRKLS